MSSSPIQKSAAIPLKTAADEPIEKRPSREDAGLAFVRDVPAFGRPRSLRSTGDFTVARDWRPGSSTLSGTEANRSITEQYEQIDRRMAKYFGDGALPNWTTFGKYASRTAGEQIDQLETVLRAFKGKEVRSWGAMLWDAVRHPIKRLKSALIMRQNLHPGPDFLKNVQALRNALVYGNTEIMKDIGAPFEAFLAAEAAGRNGLAALREAGYGQAPKDPQKFILQAFEKYAEAKALGEDIREIKASMRTEVADGKRMYFSAATGQPSEMGSRLCTLQDRQRMRMREANLLLGFHEQYLSLQRPEIFENPAVAQLIARFSRDMVIHDANGAHPLLRDGGNWADFAERMGLVEAGPRDHAADIYTLQDAKGQTRRYIVKDDEGDTIAGYFREFTSHDESARRLQQGRPKDLGDDIAPSLLDRVVRWFVG